MMKQIILDADVIIHFIKAEYLSLLPNILPNYQFIVLDTVYDEIKIPIQRTQLDNQIALLKTITKLSFSPVGEQRREYALLISRFGKGESACMTYCKYNKQVVGSSNLRDITTYCQDNSIKYLTTLDFLYYAMKAQKMSLEEVNLFIQKVKNSDSKLPSCDMRSYRPSFEIRI